MLNLDPYPPITKEQIPNDEIRAERQKERDVSQQGRDWFEKLPNEMKWELMRLYGETDALHLKHLFDGISGTVSECYWRQRQHDAKYKVQ